MPTLTSFMDKALVAGKLLALLAAGYMCVMIGLFAHNANGTLKAVNSAVANVNTVTAGLNHTLDLVNRPCSVSGQAIKTCGTLADVNTTLNTVRGTFGQVEIAAIHENKQLGTLDRQEETLVSDLHTTLLDSQGTIREGTGLLRTTKATVASVQPLLGHLDAVAVSSNAAVVRIDTLFANPAILTTMDNVSSITLHTNNILAIGEQVEAKVTKSYLHPSTNPFVRTWEGVSPYLPAIVKIAAQTIP